MMNLKGLFPPSFARAFHRERERERERDTSGYEADSARPMRFGSRVRSNDVNGLGKRRTETRETMMHLSNWLPGVRYLSTLDFKRTLTSYNFLSPYPIPDKTLPHFRSQQHPGIV